MTTTKKENNKPIETLRDRSLKATIWKNKAEKGAFFRVQFSRSWKDNNGIYHDTDSFSGTELLRLSRLAAKAYDRTAELRTVDSANAAQPQGGMS